MDELQSRETAGDVRDALSNIAKGKNKLDHAYAQSMRRIQYQEEGAKDLAMRTLAWIVLSYRQLSIQELLHALAIKPHTTWLDPSYCPSVKTLTSICAGLIRMDERSQTIDLVHKTTRDYLPLAKAIWFPNGDNDILATSLTYLSLDTFRSGRCKSDYEFERRLRSNPLYDYVTKNWGHHARASTSYQGVMDFLRSRNLLEAASQTLLASIEYKGARAGNLGYRRIRSSQDVAERMAPLHLAAYFGIELVVQLLLKEGNDVGMTDSEGNTPLHWASAKGHAKIVQLLLDRGASTELRNKRNKTALDWSSDCGYLEVVRVLLDHGASLEAKNIGGKKTFPLYEACQRGHLAIVKLLLSYNASVDFNNGKTISSPLCVAVERGHLEVSRLLLDHGTEVSRDHRDTALFWAVKQGYHEIVKLLIAHGADIMGRDFTREPALNIAARRRHIEVIRVLLQSGANVHKRGSDGRTAVDIASSDAEDNRKHGNAILKLLLEVQSKTSKTTLDI